MLSPHNVAVLPPATSPDCAGHTMMRVNNMPTWQTAASAAYARDAAASDGRLRAELAARLRALTDCALPDSAIIVDAVARRAIAALDGVVFQLQAGDLIVARSCAHCGTGRFASPPLTSRADLGHALTAWQPYHAGCEPSDPTEADW